ncbi:hypothetical protein SCUCBS95973_006659 [Sporothrix curviconia]|uniref:Ubiquitin-like protease family profile domain-containing protein n=1 Tax=Sporothrix curviconia TaxID=1260050 RepID=A0ABP0C7C1_9PEZI
MSSYELKDTKSSITAWVAHFKLVKKALTHKDEECAQQEDGWECGLLVIENTRMFVREPSTRDRAGYDNWSQARSHKAVLPQIGSPTTIQAIHALHIVGNLAHK